MEQNTCLGGKGSPAASFVSLSNLLCGSLLAIVLVFTPVIVIVFSPVWLNLVEPAAIFIPLP